MRLVRWIVVAAVALTCSRAQEPAAELTVSRWSESTEGGGSVVFSRDDGVWAALPGEAPRLLTADGEEPLMSPDGSRVLFRRAAGHTPGFDAELWWVPVHGGTPTALWKAAVGEFAESPAFSENSAFLVFTRVRWRPTAEGPALCTAPTCERPAREVVLLRLSSPEGAPTVLGAGTVGTVSSNDRFVTWLRGSQRISQEIDAFGVPVGEASARPFEPQFAMASP